MDYANDQQALASLSKLEKERGLPEGVLRSIMIQETGGKAMGYHYQPDATGRRKSSAFGPFGILRETTGPQPGYGVEPMNDVRWESFDEQARFSADYLAARIKQAGSVEAGIKSYGDGTDNYVNKVLGRTARADKPSGQVGAYVDGRYNPAGAASEDVVVPEGFTDIAIPGEVGIDGIYKEEDAEVGPEVSQFDAGTLETPTAAILEVMDSGPIQPWKPTEDQWKKYHEVEGYGPYLAQYMLGSRNEKDFESRYYRALQRHEADKDLMSRTDWSAVAGYSARMGGNMMDPVGFAATYGLGTGVNAVRSGAVLRGLASNLGRGAAVGAGANIPLDMATQALLNKDILWGQVLQQGLYGAAFGSALQIPRSVAGTRRVANDARAEQSWDTATTELARAIDEGAGADVVAGLQKTLDEAQARMLDRAAREGDAIAAEVWASAKPGADVATIQSTIAKIKAAAAEAESAEPVHGAPLIDRTRIVGQADDAPSTGPAGTRLSRFAAEITQYAKTKWADPDDPARADMIRRQREFYDLRESRLDNYKGLSNWLDSSGLQLALSKSKVARMLGDTIFEVAGGLSRREGSMAMRYEVLHSRMLHSVMQDLKEVEMASLSTANKVRYMLGLPAHGRNAFWKAVAVEGQQRRAAIANKTMDTYESQASPAVQRAASIMDHFWRDASEVMAKAGLSEGEAIKQAGWVGHIPYNWNWQKIARDFRDNLPAVEALARMLQAEYREKVLVPAIAELQTKLPEMEARHKAELEGRVAELQDALANMETARRSMADVSDTAKSAAQEVSELNALRKTYVEAEQKLRAELAELEAQLSSPPKKVEEGPLIDVVMRSTAGGDGEVVDFGRLRSKPGVVEHTATSLLQRLSESAMLKPHEQAMAKALLNDWVDDIPVLWDSSPGRAFFSPTGRSRAAGQYQPFVMVHDSIPSSGITYRYTAREMELVILHELAHARSSQWIDAVVSWEKNPTKGNTPPQHIVDTVNNLRATLAAAREAFPNPREGVKYGLSNEHEFLAQVFSSAEFRAALDTIKIDGERSLLRAVWEAVISGLGLSKDRTALTDALEVMDTLSGTHTTFVDSYKGARVQYAPDPTTRIPEIMSQLESIKAAKADTDARLAEARATRGAAKAARKSAAETSGGKKLAGLTLQLNKAKAALADHQTDPQAWGNKQLENLLKDATDKADSMAAAYVKRIMQSPEDRQRSALTHFADTSAAMLRENFDGERVSPDLADEFKKMVSEKIGDRSRTEFNLLREDSGHQLLDFMNYDGLGIAKASSHRVAGAVALAERGFDDPMKIAGAIEAARLDGATEAELKALKFGMDFLSDNLQSGDGPAVHALRNATYAAYMGKLGISMMADLPQIAAALGMSNMLRVMGSMAGQVLNGSAFIKDGKLTPLGKQLVEVAPGTMGMDHRLMSTVPDNVAGGVDFEGTSFLQRASARGAQLTSYLSGANLVNLVMHRALTPLLANEMVKSVLGNGALNPARLADMGLQGDLLVKVRAELLKHDAGRKPGDRINLDRWDDQGTAESFIEAIHRGVFQTAQKSLLGEYPSWMVDNQLGRIFGQFRRFGLTAAEKATARQLGLADKGTATLFTVGLAWAGLMWSARVHANTLGMAEQDAKKYVDENMQGARLARGMAIMFNASGLAADVATVGELMYGGTTGGGRGGPAASLGYLSNIGDSLGAPVAAATGDAAGAARSVVKILPGGNSLGGTWLQNQLNTAN